MVAERSEYPNFRLLAAIRNEARRISGVPRDYDALIHWIGDARLVLLGEATHGSHEFYRERVRITQRLIMEKGFAAVVVESDWPDAYRLNRHVQGQGADKSALAGLAEGFERFPSWMWANRDVLTLLEWIKTYNSRIASTPQKAGFYGLDVYSLFRSMDAVIAYLQNVDPEAARQAHYRYSCFEHFGEDPQVYGYVASLNLSRSCEQEVVAQLMALQRQAAAYAAQTADGSADDFFNAEQNAYVAMSAEHYYRAMYEGSNLSWNLRDTHMAETVTRLLEHLSKKRQEPAKLVIWAHNSHLGDARATEMGEGGQLNLGQLLRQRYPEQTFSVGFTTYAGTVTAASGWDGPERQKRVVPALPGSYEALFHQTGLPHFILPLVSKAEWVNDLAVPQLERAIGVIYHPQTERISHYFYASLPRQFDAVIHIDGTSAVIPLKPSAHWEAGEVPETFPTGL